MHHNDFILSIISEAEQLGTRIISHRRWLHQHPETKFEEHLTGKYVEKTLVTIGYEIKRAAGTGVIGSIQGDHPGPVIALRADMDALDITEETGLPYRSQNKGKMHACGHDAHMAMLLGAAELLYRRRDQIRGTVRLIFQPGEEGGAGAKSICDEGHLDGTDYVFGMHVWMELPSGTVLLKKGPLMAAADDFEIRISGRGGHAAQPHLTIDPVAVAVDIYNQLQKIVSREVDPLEPAVISVPYIRGSNTYNVIPDEAVMKGTVRAFDRGLQQRMIDRIIEIVEGQCNAWRCKGSVRLVDESYPPVINMDQAVDTLYRILKHSPLKLQTEADPTMGAEDFAFYLQKAPGVFIFLGMRDETKGIVYPHHHPKFRIDEDVLCTGSALYTILGCYGLLIEQELRD